MKNLSIAIQILICTIFISSFHSQTSSNNHLTTTEIKNNVSNKLKDRFTSPTNFKRVNSETNSWGEFLQNLPLKSQGSLVKHYDGSIKYNNGVYLGVVDLPIGNKNLHQCADAVMRLRADYLYSQKKYNQIEFNFVDGKKANYSNYLAGKTPNDKNLWSYLEYVFSFANTYSLDKQLKSKKINDLQIGDVFIKGGFPGHVVIVVDKAINPSNGKVKFMLAQSYMPAQEIQILTNPKNSNSPWYDLEFGDVLQTPEWSFPINQFKSF